MAVSFFQLVAPRLLFFASDQALTLSQNLLLGLSTGLCFYFLSLLVRPISKRL